MPDQWHSPTGSRAVAGRAIDSAIPLADVVPRECTGPCQRSGPQPLAELRIAPQPRDGAPHPLPVERINPQLIAFVPHDLTRSPTGGRDDGPAGAERFEDDDPEGLDAGRQHEDGGIRHRPSDLTSREDAGERDALAEAKLDRACG